MRQRFENWMPWMGIAGVTALGLGVTLALADAAGWLPSARNAMDAAGVESASSMAAPGDSLVLSLAMQSPAARAESLKAIAAQPVSDEQVRARYLLAKDLIDQGQGGSAIALLETLPDDFPELAVHSRIQLGKAQKASGATGAAQNTWAAVLQEHGDQPASGEALYQLGQQNPQYWEQLLETFPAHPRSVEVAHKRLVEAPQPQNEKALLLVMTRHGIYHPDVLTFVDRLTEKYGDQLTAEEWQAVGFAYWERQAYKSASKAYSQAPASPQVLYRAARGAQIGEQRAAAIAGYNTLNTTFPDAPETALGLIKLSYLVDKETALQLLNQVIERFPQRAAEALQEQAKIMESLDSPDTAAQLRETILTDYSHSEEAAALRSQYARNAGQASNWSGAIKWVDQLLTDNGDDDLAPEMGFWAAKWSLRAGDTESAKRRFEQVIRNYPESYFAWRAASHLGWNVGDFQTVRSLQPEIALPAQRQPLPSGSNKLQELYLLGQDQDAWALWQVEFENGQDPSVTEQFTDGVLRVGVGDNLDGIFMVSSLDWRDEPAETAAHKDVQTHPAYWQTLYPFPYANLIAQWSAERQLNPLLVTALMRQESRFEPQIRSVVGAAGLMQVMPETADWIRSKSDIAAPNLDNPNDNINLGTWYLDYTHDEYSDHSLYAVASYNAGPGNVADWINRGGYIDEDDFADKIPFPETKNYIRAVFGGYWNYLRLYNPEIARQVANL
ncbi:MAG: transglycosylase SLT domain-containing protein [Leptolyngbya sp. SIOISBB]|nr:transglycosylase SLT domain-containing protein [Leptolyngbya sp. SIOISBB]